ncbi:MAG TPA: hypothetical protein VK327_18470 [Candidatus Paceibacterota bacterium]|nr:hypothetical protein [Candidatus Paceibacterota bacterium]
MEKFDKEAFQFPSSLPFLVVDVAKTDPDFTLKFEVLNDSAPRFSSSDFSIERPEIELWIADADPGVSLNWEASPKWEKVSASGIMTNGAKMKFPGRRLLHRFQSPLPPGTGDSSPGVTFNMQEKPGGISIASLVSGRGLSPTLYCFKLLAVPSTNPTTKLKFDTNAVVWWNWKYRPVAYLPLGTPLTVSPKRVQLSDGTNTFGSKIVVANPGQSNLYGITASVEIENGTVPINSAVIDISAPKKREVIQNGELTVQFESGFDCVWYASSRLFVIPILQAGESREIWIRGTIATNSFANVSVWRVLDSFPNVRYRDGGWDWPIFSASSPWWTHIAGEPMDMGINVVARRGDTTNGFTNTIQIIPSYP